MWRGFGAGMESHTQRSRAGLEPGVLGDVCGHPLPHSQPSAGPTAVEQWGTPGEVRDGPQGPSQCRAQAEPSAKPGMLDSPCLSEAPTGWAAFGSQERAVWVRMLELVQGQGAQGQGQRRGLEPCSWEKPTALSTGETLGSAPLTGLFAAGHVRLCGASSVPEPAHRAPLLEGKQ